MPLPQSIRSLTPSSLRENVRIRALAVGSGMIPPRTMHTAAESALLCRLADKRRRVIEIGSYEGSSSVHLAAALSGDAELHLIDPFTNNALRPGQRGTGWATERVTKRAARRAQGAEVVVHPVTSAEVAEGWHGPVDLVFIDGDHSELGCLSDWKLWHDHLTAGGAVAFHDARENRPDGWGLPGPTAVVDRLFRGEAALDGWHITDEVDTVVVVTRLAR